MYNKELDQALVRTQELTSQLIEHLRSTYNAHNEERPDYEDYADLTDLDHMACDLEGFVHDRLKPLLVEQSGHLNQDGNYDYYRGAGRLSHEQMGLRTGAMKS